MITNFKLYENFLTDIDKITYWLDHMKIINYTINDDLTVDVDGDVYISYKNLAEIPVNFNKVHGYFDCRNNELISLEGCPNIIGKSFNCSNNRLTSLVGCPSTINGSFNCYNNYITSLKYCPTTINGDFDCRNNLLTSLEYFPTFIKESIYLHYNNLTNLKGCPTIVNGDFYCSYNNLVSLKGCPTKISGIFYCNSDNDLYDINDLDSQLFIKFNNNISVSNYVYDKYFEKWIEKDINIFPVLKDKVSDEIKQKYSYLFNASNFDII